jgi:hypothetical protein
MIENEKIDCVDSLTIGLNRTALWRKKMAAKFPSDPRNARAAERLAELAIDTAELTDEEFALLDPYCGRAEPWREAISKTARMVGFQKKIQDLPRFVEALIGVLQS